MIITFSSLELHTINAYYPWSYHNIGSAFAEKVAIIHKNRIYRTSELQNMGVDLA